MSRWPAGRGRSGGDPVSLNATLLPRGFLGVDVFPAHPFPSGFRRPSPQASAAAADRLRAAHLRGRALLGTGNLVLQARQADDFAPSTDLNLFTQTWSLGVEEQFYLLVPLLVFASGFVRGRAGGGAAPGDPAFAYPFLPIRLWELAAGGAGRPRPDPPSR